MEEINNNSLNEVAGGRVSIERHPDGKMKEANYYCDKCGSLVLIQKDGNYDEKIEHSMEYDMGATKVLCKNCMDKKK